MVGRRAMVRRVDGGATSRFSGFLLILLYYVTSGPKFITMV